MKFCNAVYESTASIEKKIILFGASSSWRYYFNTFDNIDEWILDKSVAIVDNDGEKQGKVFEIGTHKYDILSPSEITKMLPCVIFITVSLAYHEDICKQLLQMNLPDEIECYSLPLMAYSRKRADNSAFDAYFKKRIDNQIPAIIHCFWFSGEEKPELYQKCIDSWKMYCPNFEIIEWNSQNYDYTKNRYMKEAFEYRKWAFVSDYARLDVVNEYGGIYFDMDVELTNSIDILLRADNFFFRQDDGYVELGSGFGAKRNDVLINLLLETYQERSLILTDGNIDCTPQPEWLKGVFEKKGIKRKFDTEIVDNRIIMSNEYIRCNKKCDSVLAPVFGIHWHNGGWLTEKERRILTKAEEAKEIIANKYFCD